MGIADAARGIVDAGLVDRELVRTIRAGSVFTPLAAPLGFVTRGAPRGNWPASCAGSHAPFRTRRLGS